MGATQLEFTADEVWGMIREVDPFHRIAQGRSGSCRNTDAESISEQGGGLGPDELHMVILYKIC